MKISQLKLILTIAIIIGITLNIAAQQTTQTIKGRVINAETKEAVPFVNIIVLDSSPLKGTTSNAVGNFEIENVPVGEVTLRATFIGYQDTVVENLVLTAEKMLEVQIELEEGAKNLDQVTVQASRPLVEVLPDKTVLNVAGSTNASGHNGLELLRKAPGVMLDNNDNIIVLGKTGVKIYIDGRPSPLSGTELTELLKSMQSEQIEAIEIITNPSAKYDAEGNAGIINIRLTKQLNTGANASINLGYSAGIKSRYNTSGTVNYRNGKFNAFGSYGYYHNENANTNIIFRRQSDSTYDQQANQTSKSPNHNYKVGLDYFINDKNTIGFIFNGNSNIGNWNNVGTTKISNQTSGVLAKILWAESFENHTRKSNNMNVNYNYNDKKGKSWNFDLDYGNYNNASDTYQPNIYTTPDGNTELVKRISSTYTPTNIDIYTAKIDHTRNIKKLKLEIGAKFSYVKTDNIFDFYNVLENQNVFDTERSNQFVYTENVNAAYVNISSVINDKWSYQLGLRAEQTNSEGDLKATQVNNDKNVKRNYFDVFPSAGLSYKASDKSAWSLSVGKRLQRPSYQDLNPFENKLDELTFQKGNPFLNPQYAYNMKLSNTYNNTFSTSLSYTYTKDYITRIMDTLDVSKSFISFQNLASQEVISLTVSAPYSFTDWWSSYTSITGFSTHNQATFDDGKTIDLSVTTLSFYSQQTFSLPKDFKFEVSGFYNSPGVWGGTFKFNSIWGMDAGISKKILKDKGNLKLGVSDIFKTQGYSATSIFGGQVLDLSGYWDSRRFKVNFSYKIGNNKIKSRRRKTGQEEEQNRIKAGN